MQPPQREPVVPGNGRGMNQDKGCFAFEPHSLRQDHLASMSQAITRIVLSKLEWEHSLKKHLYKGRSAPANSGHS